MKGQLFLGKINLSKIDKSKIFEGKTGKWVDVTVWVNEEPDKYGNHMSIEQSVPKDADKIYLGNAKRWEAKSDPVKESILNEPTPPDDDTDLPF